MKQSDIESIPTLVREKKLSCREGAEKIWVEVYTHPYTYSLATMDEDERSEFLLYLSNKFQNLFASYDPQKMPFKNYIKGYLKNYLKTWRRKKTKKFAEQHSADSFFTNFSYENISTAPLPVPEVQSTRTNETPNFTKTRKRIAELSTLVLVLKACKDVDDDMIEKVSDFTGVDRNLIDEKIADLKEKLERRYRRMELLVKKRNNAFFYHRKYSVELTQLDENSDKFGEITLRKEMQTKKWMQQNEKILCVKQVAPSNADIAKVLGLKPRTISYYINRMKNEENQKTLRDLYFEADRKENL